MRIITCHIGSISPRRQARERRSLQTPKTIFRHISSCLALFASFCYVCGIFLLCSKAGLTELARKQPLTLLPASPSSEGLGYSAANPCTRASLGSVLL